MAYQVFNYLDFHKKNFIDPLYRPYLTNKNYKFNSDLLNPNETRFGKGQSFKLKSSNYPCPMGFEKGNYNWCYPIQENYGIFYSPLYKNILKHKVNGITTSKEYFDTRRVGVNDFYRNVAIRETPYKGVVDI